MKFVLWDPHAELQRLRDETDELWDAFLSKLTDESGSIDEVGFLPDVDVVETAEDVRVYVAIPGLIENDIQVVATSNSLSIRGERQPPYDPTRPHVREWRYGFFERTLRIDTPIDVEGIKATYESGVLTILLPKAAEEGGTQ